MFTKKRQSTEITFVNKHLFTDKEKETKTVEVPPSHPYWIPELPNQKKKRFKEEHGLNQEMAAKITSDKKTVETFEKLVQHHNADTTAKILTGLVKKVLNFHDTNLQQSRLNIHELSALIYTVEKQMITLESCETALRKSVKEDKHIIRVVEENTLYKREDADQLINQVLEEEPKAVNDEAVDYLLGQLMKKDNTVDPRKTRQKIKEKLGEKQ